MHFSKVLALAMATGAQLSLAAPNEARAVENRAVTKPIETLRPVTLDNRANEEPEMTTKVHPSGAAKPSGSHERPSGVAHPSGHKHESGHAHESGRAKETKKDRHSGVAHESGRAKETGKEGPGGPSGIHGYPPIETVKPDATKKGPKAFPTVSTATNEAEISMALASIHASLSSRFENPPMITARAADGAPPIPTVATATNEAFISAELHSIHLSLSSRFENPPMKTASAKKGSGETAKAHPSGAAKPSGHHHHERPSGVAHASEHHGKETGKPKMTKSGFETVTKTKAGGATDTVARFAHPTILDGSM